MKSILIGLTALISVTAFANDVVLNCEKIRGNYFYRVIITEDFDTADQTVKFYKISMITEISQLLISEDVYFKRPNNTSIASLIFDSETNGESFKLELKKNNKTGINQAAYIGRLRSNKKNLKKMNCSLY